MTTDSLVNLPLLVDSLHRVGGPENLKKIDSLLYQSVLADTTNEQALETYLKYLINDMKVDRSPEIAQRLLRHSSSIRTKMWTYCALGSIALTQGNRKSEIQNYITGIELGEKEVSELGYKSELASIYASLKVRLGYAYSANREYDKAQEIFDGVHPLLKQLCDTYGKDSQLHTLALFNIYYATNLADGKQEYDEAYKILDRELHFLEDRMSYDSPICEWRRLYSLAVNHYANIAEQRGDSALSLKMNLLDFESNELLFLSNPQAYGLDYLYSLANMAKSYEMHNQDEDAMIMIKDFMDHLLLVEEQLQNRQNLCRFYVNHSYFHILLRMDNLPKATQIAKQALEDFENAYIEDPTLRQTFASEVQELREFLKIE